MADPNLHGAIAATRCGLGARPGESAAASSDPRAWLKAQDILSATKPLNPDGSPDERKLKKERRDN